MLKNNPVLFTLLFAACFSCWISCKKSQPQPAPAPAPTPTQPAPCVQPVGIKDIVWIPRNGILATLIFRGDGKYFQNTDSSGVWSFKGCDSVYVQRATNNFYYRILSVNVDTLVLDNITLGELTYWSK